MPSSWSPSACLKDLSRHWSHCSCRATLRYTSVPVCIFHGPQLQYGRRTQHRILGWIDKYFKYAPARVEDCRFLIMIMLASVFFVPQMLSATIWGWVSDRLGRKPVMLLGLLGSAACMFLFGLSKSLAWALISRGLCGLFNGMNDT